MNDQELLKRITTNPQIFSGKPIIRGRRLAVEHILGMLAAGDTYETLRERYPFLEAEDIRACLLYAQNLVQNVQPGLKLEELVDSIPDILEQIPYLTLLVLFGSRARDDADSSSDWDFAFLCDEEKRKQYEKGEWDLFRVWGILQRAYNLLDDQIDVVEIKNCSELMAHYIAKEGLVIYERDAGLFEEFKHNKLKPPEEMKRFQKTLRAETKRKFQELRQK